MIEPIILPCSADNKDILEVYARSSVMPVGVDEDIGDRVILCVNTNANASIHLDEERARQLFNWLGTWLHTKG